MASSKRDKSCWFKLIAGNRIYGISLAIFFSLDTQK
jgi:hypothetical protein